MSTIFSFLVLFLVVTFYLITTISSEVDQSLPASTDEFSQLERNTDTLVRELPHWLDDEGRTVRRFRLSNTAGLTLTVMTYGAAVTSLVLPDGEDIVLGYDNIRQYQTADNPYFGATVGRVANRIKAGHFSLNGVLYNLTVNNNGNTLHGGLSGWDKRNWRASIQDGSVVFSLISEDGDEGFPGTVLSSVTYRLTEDNILLVTMQATTEQATPINIVNHNYYNLGGHNAGAEALYDHFVTIRGGWYTPVDADLIPTGEILPVTGTVFDLTGGVTLGQVINTVPGSKDNTGFDHNFVISREKENKMRLMTVVDYPTKNRRMKIFSNQPGLQFYTGNFLPRDGMLAKAAANYSFHGAFCVETQNFPDFVNNPQFPSGILQPGQVYNHHMAVKLEF